MLKWLARLFHKNGNGAKPEEGAECGGDKELGEVTRKNVDQHSQKLQMNMKSANDTLDGLLISAGEALGRHD